MIFELSIIVAILVVGIIGQFADRRWLGVPLGQLFWLGVVLGACWEVPLYFAGPDYLSDPLWTMGSSYPMHPLLLPITHSVLDGALFIVGVALVQAMTGMAITRRFSYQWLGLFVGYGVFQAATVEGVALLADAGWQYTPSRMNPQLFEVNGKPFTSLPLVIWTLAPALYYVIAWRFAINIRLPINSACTCRQSVAR
ncbi:MAG: hypothetical protein AAFX52_06445 [Pseudomonadota bacterium]